MHKSIVSLHRRYPDMPTSVIAERLGIAQNTVARHLSNPDPAIAMISSSLGISPNAAKQLRKLAEPKKSELNPQGILAAFGRWIGANPEKAYYLADAQRILYTELKQLAVRKNLAGPSLFDYGRLPGLGHPDHRLERTAIIVLAYATGSTRPDEPGLRALFNGHPDKQERTGYLKRAGRASDDGTVHRIEEFVANTFEWGKRLDREAG
jgi:hypothetical protein